MGIWAFRRGEALETYGGDGDVAVIPDGVDSGLNLGQFDSVTAIVRIDDGLVDGKVDIGGLLELAGLDRVGDRRDIVEYWSEDRCDRLAQRGEQIDAFLDSRVAAAADAVVDTET